MSDSEPNYWDFDPAAVIACPGCGWSGRGTDAEGLANDLIEVRCPQCDRLFKVMQCPMISETLQAAAEGNPRAAAAVPAAEALKARLTLAKKVALTEPSQLPDLPGSEVRIAWDLEDREGETWTMLRHDGVEIWREIAFYEGYERFVDVFEILLQRYGTRLVEVRPTQISRMWLFGDKLSSPQLVEALNVSLTSGEETVVERIRQQWAGSSFLSFLQRSGDDEATR
jgi:hypothetical protein